MVRAFGQAFSSPVEVGRRAVAGIHCLRLESEELGDLLDHHVMDQFGEFFETGRSSFDRTPIDDDLTRPAPGCGEPGPEGNRLDRVAAE